MEFNKKASVGLYDRQHEHDACGLGVIVNLDGEKSHDIILQGMQILRNLEHRGAVAGDEASGDGSGLMIQIPDSFLRQVLPFELPPAEHYALFQFFLPIEERKRMTLVTLCEEVAQEEKWQLHGWRDLKVDVNAMGQLARASMPFFSQLFVSLPGVAGIDLERQAYLLRRQLEKKAIEQGWSVDDFYISSSSCRTVIYKGMLKASQLPRFYEDFHHEELTSAFILVHERYSTNTLPSWSLAQPFRCLAHNGEINTLRSNINFMNARENSLKSDVWGDQLKRLLPIIQDSGSDTACLDNVFELLSLSGRSVEQTAMMMVPEAFGPSYHMSFDRKAFYEYHATFMEPWDGPAAIIFTDGKRIGATLDRNGLRPVRYTLTKQGQFVLASETGVISFPEEDIVEKGRLSPGRLLLAELGSGRLLHDSEAKSQIIRQKPYRMWMEKNRITLPHLFAPPLNPPKASASLLWQLRYFGYHYEDLHTTIKSMALRAQEPLGSMGNDAPLAVLSDRPCLIYDYFHQQFAQVTNPPIDPYRESLVMSLMGYVGRESCILEEKEEHCRLLRLEHPVLSNQDVRSLLANQRPEFLVKRVSLLYTDNKRIGRLSRAIDELCFKVEEAIDAGISCVLLSDRDADRGWLAIPALLAVSAVHHYLVSTGKRHLCALGVESGEVWEVHHFATLVSFGASVINPYLAFEVLALLREQGHLSQKRSSSFYMGQYIDAVKKGLLKAMSKIGISTLRSYRGSQIFEAIGLSSEFVDRYFPGTITRIEGVGIAQIEADLRQRQKFPQEDKSLSTAGRFQARSSGERHNFSAKVIPLLQQAVRSNDFQLFQQYSSLINSLNSERNTLRSLFELREEVHPLALSEVEEASSIVKRFVVSAMSFGSLSPEAHQTIAIAMNRIGASSNCGEGGEDPRRYTPFENGDDPCSKVKQIASGRFGVDSLYLHSAKELQIKMAQGAKPGEGGQLPNFKVDETIARIRYTTAGVGLISPPPHHDVYSIEDLAQLIYDLKMVSPQARVSVKLVSSAGVGTIAAGVVKGKADMVLIAGHDGGTGASPLSSIRYAGCSWELGLAETQQTLVRNRLRRFVRLQCDGQMKTGRDVVVAALLGAEEFGFGSAALVALGCVMMRQCHSNNCPVGIATQDERCRQHFKGRAEHLINFMFFIAEEVRLLMSKLGFQKFDDMVGAVEKISFKPALEHYKACGLNLEPLLVVPTSAYGDQAINRRFTDPQILNLRYSIEKELIAACSDALKKGKKVKVTRKIRNCNRSIGATLSYYVTDKYRHNYLADDTISLHFQGSAGQSLGAFLAHGITIHLEGDGNDYLGKGLSGGKIAVRPPANFNPNSEGQIIIGNVAFFGATAGRAFIAGMAGERFCVRNSGVYAVVEGVGDHGCEYMTGGRVVILGPVGMNFSAGMSGGIAFVLDDHQLLDTHCNLDMINIELIDDADEAFILEMLKEHVFMTGSRKAKRILDDWVAYCQSFVKVMPTDYKLALERIAASKEAAAKTMKIAI